MKTSQKILTASDYVSEQRLWDLLMDVANYGATKKGGVNRQALSPEDTAAKNHVVRWANERGFSSFHDEIGNLFIRREGNDPELDPVMTGSHLDSQPTGGRFDGAFGVLAGLEALEALNDSGIHTKRPVEVVAWTNEEGSRFSPGAMGSSVFSGVRDLHSVMDLTDPAGVALSDALKVTLSEVSAKLSSLGRVKPYSYVEAHIEQGPILEEGGIPIGVVSGIQGIRHIDINVTGEEAHAGTTPLRARTDALVGGIKIVNALHNLTFDEKDILRFTIGRFEVHPGSPNTVPGQVHFTIDLRHPDKNILNSVGDEIHTVAKNAAEDYDVEVLDIGSITPTDFEPKMINIIAKAADNLNFANITMPSGAGHDAMHLSNICPTGMIFVPCLGGVSHNEAESASSQDLAIGTKVLVDSITQLANE